MNNDVSADARGPWLVLELHHKYCIAAPAAAEDCLEVLA